MSEQAKPPTPVLEGQGAKPPVWNSLRFEASAAAAEEPLLASFLNATVLNHDSLADALSYHLAQKLAGSDMNALQLREIFASAHASDTDLTRSAERDIEAVIDRDPACRSPLQPFLYFKGFAALQTYRVANWLWSEGRETLSYYFQSRMSELFGMDIHPASKIGSGIMFDHASGIVVGETATIGDDCSILHSVTLGGTGKEVGDRHPKVGKGVLISAGASVLGNIQIGDEARIAAGSVVLKDVPSQCTVAGVPAKIVGCACAEPAKKMEQRLD